MFEIGWTELLVIGVVALIVIGPKDLPEMFRTLGRFTAKMRSMAREFQRAMETAADESGLKEAARDVRSAANLVNARSTGLDAVKEAASRFEKWEPLKPARPAAAAPADAGAPPAPAVPDPAAPRPLGPETQALADARAARMAAAEPAADAPAAPARGEAP